jgi:hypothetical protein
MAIDKTISKCKLYREVISTKIIAMSSLNKKIILIYIVLHFCNSSISQVIQADTLGLKGTKPFDKPFVLKIPGLKNYSISGVEMYKVKSNGCIAPINGCFRIRGTNYFTPVNLSAVKDSLGNAYVNIFPLLPNRRYLLLIDTVKPPERIMELVKEMDKIEQVQYLIDSKQLRGLYEEIVQNDSMFVSTIYPSECKKCKGVPFNPPRYEYVIEAYINDLRPIRLKLKNISDEQYDEKKLCTPSLDLVDNNFYDHFINYSENCRKCKDTIKEYQIILGLKSNVFRQIINIKNASDLSLSYGYLPLDSFGTTYIPEEIDLEKRMNNLLTSIQIINGLNDLCAFYAKKYGTLPDHSIFTANCIAIKNCYTKNYNYLKTIRDNEVKRKKIEKATRDAIYNDHLFNMPVLSIGTNTFLYDFQTRTNFAVKADFGFLVYGNIMREITKKNGKESADFWGASPYLGFHLNLRNIDTDVPFNTIPGIKKFFSLTGGVLIASLNDNNRVTGLIGNTSIFTGGAFALWSHGVRLNLGAVWFKMKDINPLRSKTEVSAVPFAGLSIDFRIQDVYRSFAKLFP